MPEVYVYAVAGRTAEQKKRLCEEITESVARNFGGGKDSVTVQIVEAPADSKSKGGVMFSDR